MVGCRSNSVKVYINCFQIIKRKNQTLRELMDFSFSQLFALGALWIWALKLTMGYLLQGNQCSPGLLLHTTDIIMETFEPRMLNLCLCAIIILSCVCATLLDSVKSIDIQELSTTAVSQAMTVVTFDFLHHCFLCLSIYEAYVMPSLLEDLSCTIYSRFVLLQNNVMHSHTLLPKN